MTRLPKWLGCGSAGVLTPDSDIMFVFGLVTETPCEETPDDQTKGNTAVNDKVHCGTRITANIFSPAGYKVGHKLPTIINLPSIWRTNQPTFLDRVK